MQKHLYLNQKIRIYQNHKLCPYEITNNFGKDATIKGFRRINRTTIMPLVEFKNQKRMWLFNEEIYESNMQRTHYITYC